MTTKLLRQITGFILAPLLLTGTLLVAGNSAAAQQRFQRRIVVVRPFRPYDPYRGPYGRTYGYYRQYVFSNSEDAYSQGYKDGMETGEKDGRKGNSYDPERSHYFHDSGFGNFAEAYREGFTSGYRDGFGRRVS